MQREVPWEIIIEVEEALRELEALDADEDHNDDDDNDDESEDERSDGENDDIVDANEDRDDDDDEIAINNVSTSTEKDILFNINVIHSDLKLSDTNIRTCRFMIFNFLTRI